MALLSFFLDHSASFLGENFSHYGSHPWELQRLSTIWIHYVKGMKARESVENVYEKEAFVYITLCIAANIIILTDPKCAAW